MSSKAKAEVQEGVDFTMPVIPPVPDGYTFSGFTVARTGHKLAEKNVSDHAKAMMAVEAMILDCCVVYATCSPTGEPSDKPELDCVWKVGSATWGPWKVI